MAARYSHDSYQIGIICALPLERTAVECMLDEEHGALSAATGDNNTYTFGKVGGHNVVVASLGAGEYGTVSASGVANDTRRSFSKFKYGLMVGIAGGIPRPQNPAGDIRLGDIVVGCANGVPSVINYRLGKQTVTGFEIRSELAKPPQTIQTAVSALQSRHMTHGPTYLTHLAEMLQKNPRLNNSKFPADYYIMPESPDCLFETSFLHISDASDCQPCQQQQEKLVRRGQRHLRQPPADVHDTKFVRFMDKGGADYPNVHLTTVASADTLMKDAVERDKIYGYIKDQRKATALCFEMEAAGIVDNWPCLVIRGICDYSDSHKQKEWQNFAAATAAAYAKDLLLRIAPEVVEEAQSAEGVVSQGRS